MGTTSGWFSIAIAVALVLLFVGKKSRLGGSRKASKEELDEAIARFKNRTGDEE